MSALGWVSPSNLELLVEEHASSHGFIAFEDQLVAKSVRVDDEFRDAIATAADALRDRVQRIGVSPAYDDLGESERVDQSEVPWERWFPHLRQPEQLFRVYSDSREDSIPAVAREAAVTDLRVLHMPNGLLENEFRAAVGASLLSFPVVRSLDAYVAEPRPFGVVRGMLQEHLGCDRDEAEAVLQTLIRWLRHFLPDRYRYERPRHSEILWRP